MDDDYIPTTFDEILYQLDGAGLVIEDYDAIRERLRKVFDARLETPLYYQTEEVLNG